MVRGERVCAAAGPHASSRGEESSMNMCKLEGCTRRAYVDVKSSRIYEYCGRKHAAEAAAADGRGPLSRPSETCAFPGCDRTVWFDDDVGRVHDFCGIKHAQEAEKVRGRAGEEEGRGRKTERGTERVGGGSEAKDNDICLALRKRTISV